MDLIKERLQKVLARQGLGSRRQVESWMEEGRITLNGAPAKLGDKVGPKDVVTVDGKRIELEDKDVIPARVMVYHKPEGQICTMDDPEGRETVFTHFPKLKLGRWITVGRLDINTSGLLLVTTDGELANRLMHPSYEVEREYACRLFGEVTPDVLKNVKKGVTLDDGEHAAFNEVHPMEGEGVNQWFRVILKEGKYREVRRIWESQGLKVNRLIRTRYARVKLPRNLSPSKWQELSIEEMNQLRQLVGLPVLEPEKVDYRKTCQQRKRANLTQNKVKKRMNTSRPRMTKRR